MRQFDPMIVRCAGDVASLRARSPRRGCRGQPMIDVVLLVGLARYICNLYLIMNDYSDATQGRVVLKPL